MKNKWIFLITNLLIFFVSVASWGLPARNPLQPLKENSSVEQPLQKISVSALRMVGVLRDENRIWALLATPTNQIYPVSINTKVGMQQGKVTSITDTQLIVSETALDGKNIRTHEILLKIKR